LERERKALEKNLAGIKNMPGLPDALFVIDSKNEEIGVAEARRLGIPVIAIVDTNCDPDVVDYVIPGNDDALRAVRLFASRIADAVLEGQQMLTEGGAAAAEPATEEGETPEAVESEAASAEEITNAVGAEIEPPLAAAEPTEIGSEDDTENENAEVLAAS